MSTEGEHFSCQHCWMGGIGEEEYIVNTQREKADKWSHAQAGTKTVSEELREGIRK